MTYGFKVVEEMVSGLAAYMESKGYRDDRRLLRPRRALGHRLADLNLNYVVKAEIDQDLCIQCGRCHIVCEDTSHQAIFAREWEAAVRRQRRRMRRLQSLRARLSGRGLHHARPQDTGVDPRTGLRYDRPAAAWTAHPNNPSVAQAAE